MRYSIAINCKKYALNTTERKKNKVFKFISLEKKYV